MMGQLYKICFFIFLSFPLLVSAAKDESNWNNVIKNQYFPAKSIQLTDDIIKIDLPYRAEDPALVPLKISSSIKQTQNQYIKKITIFVDKNPFPFAGEFEFTSESGKVDLAMRIRINTYSFVRAIAEMNDGRLYMSKQFVKASGGCSAPIGADLDAAMKRLGKIKFRLAQNSKIGEGKLVQLLLSHPNVTGMQMNQVTRVIRKPHFIDQLKVTLAGKPILTAKLDIAMSADPNFRFYLTPNQSGILKAEFSDTFCETPSSRDVCKKGKSYANSYHVKP